MVVSCGITLDGTEIIYNKFMFKRALDFIRVHKLLFELAAVLIITIPAFVSLINPHYFSMHDDQHIARLFLLDQGIRQGYFFPRWVDTLGFNFGYPLFNFYPPLVYYIGELFHLVGFSYTASIKLVFITGFISGAFGTYFLARRHLGRAAGFLASVLYTYFFYHATLVYVRGALAEFFTLGLLPFIFLSLDSLRERPNFKRSIVFGVVFALLILNHPLIAVPLLFYIGFTYIFYLIISPKKRVRLTRSIVSGGLIGLLLSAFFWLPSIAEKQYTLVDSILTKELADYKIHFVCLNQLINSPWGFGGSIPGCFDGLTFQLGKIHLGLLILAGITALWVAVKRTKISENFEYFTFFLFLLLFSLFMTVASSRPVWDSISYLWYLQFPWRFFTFTALFISMTGAFALHYSHRLLSTHHFPLDTIRKVQIVFLLVVSVLTIAVYQKYFRPSSYVKTSDRERTSFYEIADRISRTSFEFVPRGVKTKPSELNTTAFDIAKKDIPTSRYKVVKGSASVNVVKDNFNEKILQTDSTEPGILQLNTFAFPGWKYYLDGKEDIYGADNIYKRITVPLPQGHHELKFRFEDTLPRKIGNIASAATLFGLLLFFGLQFKKRKA